MTLLREISVALRAAAAVLGTALFITLSFFYRQRPHQYVSITEEDEQGCKPLVQVLVLGLDGAGKSSILRGLKPQESRQKRSVCRPTRGFNFLSLHSPTCQLHFLEIGGAEDLRCYWSAYLRRSHLVLFVVDSSDTQRLPLAKDELHRLLRAEPQLPVVVLGNKQDKLGTQAVWDLRRSLSLPSHGESRKLLLLLSQLDSDGSLRTSVQERSTQDSVRLQDLLLTLTGH